MAPAWIKAQAQTEPVTQMPAGTVKMSDKMELLDLRAADAMLPTAAVPKAETEHQYTDWEDLDWAKWSDDTWWAISGFKISGENHFKVQKRTATDNAELFQLKFVDPFNSGQDFVLDCNSRSYACTSEKQESGISCTDVTGHTYETFKVYAANTSINQSVVSVAGGRVWIYLCFEFNDKGGAYSLSTGIVTFDHAASLDYEVTIPATGNIFGKDKIQAEIQLKPLGDVKMFKYFVGDARGNSPSLSQLFTTYADKLQTATDLIRFPLIEYMYNVYLIPCNDKGEWLGFEHDGTYIWNMRACEIASNADEDCEWTNYGEALFMDDTFNNHVLYEKMQVLTRKDAPGKYLRLVNPYGPDVPAVQQLLANETDYADFGIVTSEDFYIDIEVQDTNYAFMWNRPIGIYMKSSSKAMCGNATPISPMASNANGMYRWGRYVFNYHPRTALVFDTPLRIQSLSCSADGFTIEADDNVAYVKYTIIHSWETPYDVADRVADGSYDGTLLTAQAQAESRAGGKVVKIPLGTEVLNMSVGDRLLAVPYTSGDEVIESYLDAPVSVWRGIGNAKIDIDGQNYFWFRDECEVEQFGNESKYRLVRPARTITNPVAQSSEYLYIDATNPDEVNFSSDGDMDDYTIGQRLNDNYSNIMPASFNTIRNWVAKKVVSTSSTYTYGKFRDGVVTTDNRTFGLRYYDINDNYNIEYIPSALTITLPGALSAIGNVTVDDSTVTDADTPAEYYNLQGVRVSDDNLTPGIYIVRKGNAVGKILVK